jgi:hypothetical protein
LFLLRAVLPEEEREDEEEDREERERDDLEELVFGLEKELREEEDRGED